MSESEATSDNLTLDFSATDPVCGMKVDSSQVRGKARYQGESYFFCSPGCMSKFTADPTKYLPANGEPAAAAQPARKKVERDPVCGMTVDAAQSAATAGYDRQLYHFCSRSCAEKFQRDPKKYLSSQSTQNRRITATANLDANKSAGVTGMVQIGAPPATPGSAPVQIGAPPKIEKDVV